MPLTAREKAMFKAVYDIITERDTDQIWLALAHVQAELENPQCLWAAEEYDVYAIVCYINGCIPLSPAEVEAGGSDIHKGRILDIDEHLNHDLEDDQDTKPMEPPHATD